MLKPNQIDNRISHILTLGVLCCPHIHVIDAPLLDAHITSELPQIEHSHNIALPPGYAATRALYRATHLDPTRYRPSAEALWRRWRDKRDFPRVHPLVDLTNLLSLKFQLCYGLYDLDTLSGPLEADLGTSADGYEGIRKDYITLAGKIMLRDAKGPFGNPSGDSLRASVNAATSSILQVIFFPAAFAGKETVERDTQTAMQQFFTWDRM